MRINRYLKFLCVAFLSTVISCAAPTTKEIKLSDAEIRREERIQKDMARKYPVKRIKRQRSGLEYYKGRLLDVSPRLSKAASQICRGDCNYTFNVVDEEVLNAWADGTTVNITPIMIDFLDSEKELAIILSHELAHNIMGHIPKKQRNIFTGALLDAAAAVGGVDTAGSFSKIASHSYSQQFENEADYVGTYIMALAGYDITMVNFLWRKMAVESPGNIKNTFFSTHPSHAERFLRMEKTIAEINEKKKNGISLLPEAKSS